MVLVLAWCHGERGAHRVSGPELLPIALVLAIGGGLLWRFGTAGSAMAPTQVATAGRAVNTTPAAAARGSTSPAASASSTSRSATVVAAASTLLEGSVQKSGNQVLINVQLIDAQTDNHLWAESYTRTLDNIFGVEG